MRIRMSAPFSFALLVRFPILPSPSLHSPSLHPPSLHLPFIHSPSFHPPSLHSPSLRSPSFHSPFFHLYLHHSSLRNNLLTGKVLEPVPASISTYKLDNNYLSQRFTSPPPCTQGYIIYGANYADKPAQGLACADNPQKANPICNAFCGVSGVSSPFVDACNGHGVCVLDGPSNTPTCLCDENCVVGELPGSCLPVAGGRTEQDLMPMLTTTGNAAVSATTFTLTPSQPSKQGGVFMAARVPLFSYQIIGDSCGCQLAFSSSFSFTLTRPDASGSEGFAFVVAFDSTLPTTPVAGSMGYAGMGARSVAVEFDTSKDAGKSDPNSSHVGINTGGSVVSASPRPTKPLLWARISLCEELAPTISEFSRPPSSSEAALSVSGMNLFFRYASSGSVAAENGNDVYGDCWAYAVVGSIEAAYGIMAKLAPVQPLPVEQLKAAMKADCSGSTPSEAFQLLPKLAQKGRGLVLESQGSAGKGKKAVLPTPFPIKGFESTSFYDWFGLLLAVQRQLVVVHIEASADSFKDYNGDPACFTYNLNHVVLLVGYRLVGKDSRFPHMALPFWIIRNSWGPNWGDGGHMRMDIQGGGGVCGINSLPGLYPVVREDACKAAQRNPCAVG
ncbi:unnamed protein product [Closterium sp. NIES-64]|nr:unnamed protein product [Closterium sp. NIES-64]